MADQFLNKAGLTLLWGKIKTILNNKVDKIDGKGLSANDYTTAEKTKLAGISSGAQVNSVTGVKGSAENAYRTGDINLTAAEIGAAASSHSHTIANITGLQDALGVTVASESGAFGLRYYDGLLQVQSGNTWVTIPLDGFPLAQSASED